MPRSPDTRQAGSYDPETYWSRVAADLDRRDDGRVVAGIDSPYFRYQRGRFVSRFLSSIDVQGKAILEVGCGPGGNLTVLAGRGPSRLVGVDVSAAMLALARKETNDVRPPIEFLKSNGSDLPLPDRAMDLSLTVTVLQHNPDVAVFVALVSEICRVTSDQVILIEETAQRQVSREPQMMRRPVDVYRAVCAKNGYRLVQTDYLRTRATFHVDRVINGVGRRVGLRASGGQRAPRPLWEVLDVANALARPFDEVVPETEGLTRMTFSRVEGRS